MTEIVMNIGRRPNEVWTQEAVDSLVGQRPTFRGRPAEVIEARLDEDGLVLTIRVDA